MASSGLVVMTGAEAEVRRSLNSVKVCIGWAGGWEYLYQRKYTGVFIWNGQTCIRYFQFIWVNWIICTQKKVPNFSQDIQRTVVWEYLVHLYRQSVVSMCFFHRHMTVLRMTRFNGNTQTHTHTHTPLLELCAEAVILFTSLQALKPSVTLLLSAASSFTVSAIKSPRSETSHTDTHFLITRCYFFNLNNLF